MTSNRLQPNHLFSNILQEVNTIKRWFHHPPPQKKGGGMKWGKRIHVIMKSNLYVHGFIVRFVSIANK